MRKKTPPTIALLTVGFSVLFASAASAQDVWVGDVEEDYLRVLQISGRVDVGSFTVRPLRIESLDALLAGVSHPWSREVADPESSSAVRAAFAGARLRTYANTDFPVGQNDGAVWKGRGFTTALDLGGRARWRGLSASLHPALIFNQNASFPLAPVTGQSQSEYAYPWRRIDLPQRFGPDPFWTLDPGQSEVRLRGYGATVGFGTTNLQWGPGIRNSIVMSGNAAGFPHFSLGTDGPVGIGIGRLEAMWIWGDLDQSEWFDAPRDDRYITGIVVTYSPSFLDGLSLGVTRVFYALEPEDGVPLGDYFMVFQDVRKSSFSTPENPYGDDEQDQLLSLFGRWVLPESGFEVYAEWARNDHSGDFMDFVLEPEHAQAYLLGLQKVVELSGEGLLVLRGELTHLERNRTLEVRASPVYYSHHIITQGYTQKGQVIGAGVGPGGNSQHVGADLYQPWGRAGLYVQRDVRDNDAYYSWAEENEENLDLPFAYHDVPLHMGAHALRVAGDFQIGMEAVLTREFNRYFGREAWNFGVGVMARWKPR